MTFARPADPSTRNDRMTRPDPATPRSSSARRGGFSFVELMFAVIVLGIGMIMVAAMFPVGIALSKQAQEGTNGAIIGRAARDTVAALANERPAGLPYTLPPTDLVNVTPTFAEPSAALRHVGTPGLGVAYDEGMYRAQERDTADSDSLFQSDSYDEESYADIEGISGAGVSNGDGSLPIFGNSTAYVPGKVMAFGDPRFNNTFAVDNADDALPWEDILRDKARGATIVATDRRFGLIPMYARGRTFVNGTGGQVNTNAFNASGNPVVLSIADPTATFIVVAVQSRATTQYRDSDLAGSTFDPVPVLVELDEADDAEGFSSPGAPDRVRFVDEGGSVFDLDDEEVAMVADGAFLVISDDRLPGDDPDTARDESNGSSNGRVYRLGRNVEDGTATWELRPGYGMRYLDPNGSPGDEDDFDDTLPPANPTYDGDGVPAVALLVGGKQLDNPRIPYDPATIPYLDNAQAIAVFSSVVPVSQ